MASVTLPSVSTVTSGNSTSNATTSSPSRTTDGNTCCYIINDSVGVNTWYTNTANITIATAVTHWLQYNDTIVPANTSIIHVPNATNLYGQYAQSANDHPYTTLPPVVITDTQTLTYGSTPSTYTDTYTLTSVLYTAASIPTNIPSTLLEVPGAIGVVYQETWIGTETALTYTDQDLTV
ncbi:hypothetical protein LTR15_010346 [Elasticomyces elasticus]|nr:hypothetical protein LTR15_010346 [Elasticomyces elasticus]